MSSEVEIVRESTGDVATISHGELSVAQVIAHANKIDEIVRSVMKDGHDYGNIPGVDKKCLFKPGADKLGMIFRMIPEYAVEEQRDGAHRTYVVTCTLRNATTGTVMGSGVGLCSTKESKYAYRNSQRRCPACGLESIIKGKEEYGGGWLCYAKRGGCGAKYQESDAEITSQVPGRVENEFIADTYNTCLKMGEKRAHASAIITATACSHLFTMDVEDGQENAQAVAAPAPRAAKPDIMPRAKPAAAPKTETAKEAPKPQQPSAGSAPQKIVARVLTAAPSTSSTGKKFMTVTVQVDGDTPFDMYCWHTTVAEELVSAVQGGQPIEITYETKTSGGRTYHNIESVDTVPF